MSIQKSYTIDGNKFSNFAEFVSEFSSTIFGGPNSWTGNLDQLNDMLRDESDASDPNVKWSIRWLNSEKSKKDLGYDATYEFLLSQKQRVHPTNQDMWETRLNEAKNRQGKILFETILEIIKTHKNIDVILD